MSGIFLGKLIEIIQFYHLLIFKVAGFRKPFFIRPRGRIYF